jgi:hypothetical protein
LAEALVLSREAPEEAAAALGRSIRVTLLVT